MALETNDSESVEIRLRHAIDRYFRSEREHFKPSSCLLMLLLDLKCCTGFVADNLGSLLEKATVNGLAEFEGRAVQAWIAGRMLPILPETKYEPDADSLLKEFLNRYVSSEVGLQNHRQVNLLCMVIAHSLEVVGQDVKEFAIRHSLDSSYSAYISQAYHTLNMRFLSRCLPEG
jgi:hypothetical protein